MECINCSSTTVDNQDLCESCSIEMEKMMNHHDETTNSYLVDVKSNLLTQKTSLTGDLIDKNPDLIKNRIDNAPLESENYKRNFIIITVIMIIIFLIFK